MTKVYHIKELKKNILQKGCLSQFARTIHNSNFARLFKTQGAGIQLGASF